VAASLPIGVTPSRLHLICTEESAVCLPIPSMCFRILGPGERRTGQTPEPRASCPPFSVLHLTHGLPRPDLSFLHLAFRPNPLAMHSQHPIPTHHHPSPALAPLTPHTQGNPDVVAHLPDSDDKIHGDSVRRHEAHAGANASAEHEKRKAERALDHDLKESAFQSGHALGSGFGKPEGAPYK
jgi:hypothetical protein